MAHNKLHKRFLVDVHAVLIRELTGVIEEVRSHGILAVLRHLDKTVIANVLLHKVTVICFGDHNKTCAVGQILMISRESVFQRMGAGAGTDSHLFPSLCQPW